MAAGATDTDFTNTDLNSQRIGAILKGTREELSHSLSDVAKLLNYKNVNFISMVEHGRSKPPVAKMAAFSKAYQLDQVFTAVMVKYLYPDVWSAFVSILGNEEIFENKCISQINREVDKLMKKLMKKFNIE